MEQDTLNRPQLLRSSHELGELFDALSAAQGEMTDPPKDKKATLQLKSGQAYSYKYSDLADLLQGMRPVFARHGLCLLQFPITLPGGGVTIVTRIGHKSGQWIEGDLTMALGDDRPQTLGSSITYGRRYSGGAAAGVSPDEDEDANVAQDAAPEGKKNATQPKPTVTPAQGAQAAAEASLLAGTPTPRPKKYNHALAADRATLVALFDKRKLDHSHLDPIGKSLSGRPWADMDAVLKQHGI